MSQEKYDDLNEPTQTPATPSADTPLQKATINDEPNKQAVSSTITTETKPESTPEAEGTSEAGDNIADNNDPPLPCQSCGTNFPLNYMAGILTYIH